MKVTNGDIFRAREPLQKLMAEKFPVITSYKLAKMASQLQEQLKVMEDVRNGLIKKYGTKDERGRFTVQPESENWARFVEEFEELMSQEVTIVFEKVKLPQKIAATCDACHHNMDKSYEIEAQTLMALDKFIEV